MLSSIEQKISAGAFALLFGAGNSMHCGGFGAFGARYDRALARCRCRLDSRRRRGNSRRRNSRAHFAAEVPVGRMGRYAPDRALARDAHDGDDDVRLRRGLSPPGESPGAPAPDPGRYWRVYGVYSVELRQRILRSGRKFLRPPLSIISKRLPSAGSIWTTSITSSRAGSLRELRFAR